MPKSDRDVKGKGDRLSQPLILRIPPPKKKFLLPSLAAKPNALNTTIDQGILLPWGKTYRKRPTGIMDLIGGRNAQNI
jgi:hypothetical protein